MSIQTYLPGILDVYLRNNLWISSQIQNFMRENNSFRWSVIKININSSNFCWWVFLWKLNRRIFCACWTRGWMKVDFCAYRENKISRNLMEFTNFRKKRGKLFRLKPLCWQRTVPSSSSSWSTWSASSAHPGSGASSSSPWTSWTSVPSYPSSWTLW